MGERTVHATAHAVHAVHATAHAAAHAVAHAGAHAAHAHATIHHPATVHAHAVHAHAATGAHTAAAAAHTAAAAAAHTAAAVTTTRNNWPQGLRTSRATTAAHREKHPRPVDAHATRPRNRHLTGALAVVLREFDDEWSLAAIESHAIERERLGCLCAGVKLHECLAAREARARIHQNAALDDAPKLIEEAHHLGLAVV